MSIQEEVDSRLINDAPGSVFGYTEVLEKLNDHLKSENKRLREEIERLREEIYSIEKSVQKNIETIDDGIKYSKEFRNVYI